MMKVGVNLLFSLWQPLIEWFEMWIWPMNSWCMLKHDCTVSQGDKWVMAPDKCGQMHSMGYSTTCYSINIYIAFRLSDLTSPEGLPCYGRIVLLVLQNLSKPYIYIYIYIYIYLVLYDKGRIFLSFKLLAYISKIWKLTVQIRPLLTREEWRVQLTVHESNAKHHSEHN